MKLKKMVLFILFFIGLLITFYYFGVFKISCDDDKCFQEAINFCIPKKYEKNINNNIYEYVISRSLGEDCEIKINLRRSAQGVDFDTKGKIEGKSMECLMPKNELSKVNFTEVENLLSYCTGPLKEGIYEILIKKMYSIIISNLGEILGEVQIELIKKV